MERNCAVPDRRPSLLGESAPALPKPSCGKEIPANFRLFLFAFPHAFDYAERASNSRGFERPGRIMLEWRQLVHLSDAELACLDVAEVNLACAQGLPGTENLNIALCLETLHQWAKYVRQYTKRVARQFERNRQDYENSWAYFRVLAMATALYQDLGLRYNEERMANLDAKDFFKNAQDVFIHGALSGQGGTCTSLPVVYAAVGRRLGYPLRLVTSHAHLFARWDEPGGERFNIEASRGLNTFPDEYYLNWPRKVRPEWVQIGWHLKSRTPREELSFFLNTRAECWSDNGRFREAAESMAWAHAVAPHIRMARNGLILTLDRWYRKLKEMWPVHFPPVTMNFPPPRFPRLGDNIEHNMIYLEAMDFLLGDRVYNRQWWEPMRRSPEYRPPTLPTRITVQYPPNPDEAPMRLLFNY